MSSVEAVFEVGDVAVYPTRGVAQVVARQTQQFGTHEVECYCLEVMGSGMTITVPVAKAGENGMRPVADDQAQADLFAVLSDHDIEEDRETWNRRHRRFMDKIRGGALCQVGEVVRDLTVRGHGKKLSHSERKVLRTARELLIQELSVARKATEDEIAKELDSVLQN